MFKNKLNVVLAVIIILLMATIVAQPVITPLNNVQIKGWLIGKDAQFSGTRTWGYTGAIDTLVISGVTTDCAVYLQPKTTQIENLIYSVSANNDTVFVTSDSAGTATTDKYDYMIVSNPYGGS